MDDKTKKAFEKVTKDDGLATKVATDIARALNLQVSSTGRFLYRTRGLCLRAGWAAVMLRRRATT